MLNHHTKRQTTLASCIALAIAAVPLPGCGGGGSGGEKPGASSNVEESGNGESPDGNNGEEYTSFNGGLKGAIYYTNLATEYHYRLDLETGATVPIDALSKAKASSTSNVSTRMLGYEIIIANKQYAVFYEDYFSANYQIRVNFLNDKMEEVGRSYAFGGHADSFGVSPDGKYFSLIYYPDKYEGRKRYLMVLNKEGNILWERRSYDPDFTITDHVWTKNGNGILFMEGNQLMLVDFFKNAEVREIKNFNALGIRLNWKLEIDPTGSKLAFDASSGPNKEDIHIYTMNIDGTGLKQLTNGPDGENGVSWFGDGKSMLVTSGGWETNQTTMCKRKLFWVSEDAELASLPDSLASTDPLVIPIVTKRTNEPNEYIEEVCVVADVHAEWGF